MLRLLVPEPVGGAGVGGPGGRSRRARRPPRRRGRRRGAGAARSRPRRGRRRARSSSSRSVRRRWSSGGAVEAVATGRSRGDHQPDALDVAKHPRRPSGRLGGLVDRQCVGRHGPDISTTMSRLGSIPGVPVRGAPREGSGRPGGPSAAPRCGRRRESSEWRGRPRAAALLPRRRRCARGRALPPRAARGRTARGRIRPPRPATPLRCSRLRPGSRAARRGRGCERPTGGRAPPRRPSVVAPPGTGPTIRVAQLWLPSQATVRTHSGCPGAARQDALSCGLDSRRRPPSRPVGRGLQRRRAAPGELVARPGGVVGGDPHPHAAGGRLRREREGRCSEVVPPREHNGGARIEHARAGALVPSLADRLTRAPPQGVGDLRGAHARPRLTHEGRRAGDQRAEKLVPWA